MKAGAELEIVKEIGIEKQLQTEAFQQQQTKLGDDGLPESSMTKPSASASGIRREVVEEFDDDEGVGARPTGKSAPKVKREPSPMVIDDDDDEGGPSAGGTDYRAHLSKFGIGGDDKGKGKATTTARGGGTRGRAGGRAAATSSRSKSKQDDDSFDSDDSDGAAPSSTTKGKATRGRGGSTTASRGRVSKAKETQPEKTKSTSLLDLINRKKSSQTFIDLESNAETATSKRPREG